MKDYRNLLIVLILVFVDQYTKYLAQKNLQLGECVEFIKYFINFDLVRNTGLAFSFAQGHIQLTSLISVIVTILLLTYYLTNSQIRLNKITNLAFMFLFGGAIGNIIDRLRLGFVIDFIDFAFVNFPVFNFADVFIDIGIILLLINNFNLSKVESQKTN